MRNLRGGLLAWLFVNGIVQTLPAAPAEIVVAIRYLQQTGTSHAHLYLYREDGKLLRQLTKDDGGQDRNPVFAPDGETIVFTRELPGGVKQWWSVEPRGTHLHSLAAAPDWYRQTTDSPCFVYPKAADEPTPTPAETAPPPTAPPDAIRPVFPVDDAVEVVLTPTPAASKENPDEWFVHWRERKTGREMPRGEMTGWAPLQLLDQEGGAARASLLEEAFRVAFISTSLGSTDGATVYAVGPGKPGFVRLARNWAVPFPLRGEAAFLTYAEERYVPFGDGAHTANCSYADHWDARLQRVRYARKDAAAICYGASIYRPGKTPAVVTMLAWDGTGG